MVVLLTDMYTFTGSCASLSCIYIEYITHTISSRLSRVQVMIVLQKDEKEEQYSAISLTLGHARGEFKH